MSRYQVDKVMRQVVMSPERAAAFRDDASLFLEGFELTDEERTALVQQDVGALYALGAHPFLLWGWFRNVQDRTREDMARYYTQAVTPHGYPDFGT
ncbi:MAG TPA: hypothetical protein VK009_25205 [Chloroflexota bacterium]|nr:hypothetical protein [Chloroflexota bacterium]